MDNVLRIQVKNSYDELWNDRPIPILVDGKYYYLFNEYGFWYLDNEVVVLLDLPTADEVYFSPTGILYCCTFEQNKLCVSCFRVKGSTFLLMEEYSLDLLDSNSINIISTNLGIDIWIHENQQIRKIYSINEELIYRHDLALDIPDEEGEIVYIDEKRIVFLSDKGIQGVILIVVDYVHNIKNIYPASSILNNFGMLWLINFKVFDNDQILYGLYNVDIGEFLQFPGPILEVGGNGDYIVVSVLTGNNVELYRITKDKRGKFIISKLLMPSGYKSLSADGSICAVRGYEKYLSIYFTESLSSTKLINLGYVANSSDLRANYVEGRAKDKAIGTIIHFHGGPESYEVPEGRFFGLPQWCMEHSIDWIGVNYRGSLSPNHRFTIAAWQKWRKTLTEDLCLALEKSTGSIILSGWSFGAAISLALANKSARIKGLLIGGSPGGLREHVARANELDKNHKSWFETRFSLEGDDGEFFNGISGFREDVAVLEFHGTEDRQCPIDLITKVAKQWEIKGNSWQQILLPGQQHYASTSEDQVLIVENMRKFISKIMLDN